MSQSVQMHDAPDPIGRVIQWWRNWARTRRTMADLERCGPSEVEHLAHDVGLNRQEICTLAGQWPGSADLLSQRLAGVKLDIAEIARREPQVVRDLERVCTLCASKRRCQHDLAKDPADPVWREYCPNTMTLNALAAERAIRGNKRAT
jgi:uncharacterized protein YjiS (DUF1127 family)